MNECAESLIFFLMPNLCINVFYSLPPLDYNFPCSRIEVQGSYLSHCPVQSSSRAGGCLGGCKDQLSPLLSLCPPNQARSSCPGSLDSSASLSSDFLLHEDPKPKLPLSPLPPPLLQYPALAKGPGLEPCPPPLFPPVAPPPAMVQEEPLLSPRFSFPTVPTRRVSPLPTPSAFPPTPQPVPGPAPTPFPMDLLPLGYPEPPFGPHFTVPQGARPRGKSPTPTTRGRKPSPPTLAPATAGGNNPCLTQLLKAGEMGGAGSTERLMGTKCGSGEPVAVEGEG